MIHTHLWRSEKPNHEGDQMAWLWTTLAVFAAVSLIHGLVKKMKAKKLPPGPRRLPILGHLHLMIGKNNPHQYLNKLAKQHGPIMYLRFGYVDNIIVSSPQAAELFLKTHDLVFTNRPPNEAAKYISYDQKNLSFSHYGPYWRNMRKLCSLELLSNHKINSFRAVRREELCYHIESLKEAALNHVAVDLSAKVSELTADISCRMVFGKKYEIKDIDERGFKAVINEATQLVFKPNLGDYFPYLGKLDLQGLTAPTKAIAKVFDRFLERIIDDHEHRGSSGQTTKDFVDIMLSIMKSGKSEFQFNREHIKSVLLDMLVASMDSSATVIEWIMSELLRHPQIMKNVQQELESKVSLDRMLEESDLEGLNYLEMVIKETFRLHPPGPLLIPRAAREDCIVDDFHIPKKARIIVNVWAIGHDPNVWTNPDKFIPERFEGSNIDYRGCNFELIPFGSGRRSCPGLQLGMVVVRLVVAQLVHCFDWELPNGMSPKELDVTEEFALVTTRAKHLVTIPSYRLHI
ncbi:cytochrome P450 CYP736A12-like [Ipomoea triloba]|uniref:cytochrome P450 CYP736A12-like n=1 Tax=Ipomoea triloba TaxID=35885 RepID=UPI00125E9B0B|nr:cytochrome P450 CYP736A12-like [Ipomoea triloba]